MVDFKQQHKQSKDGASKENHLEQYHGSIQATVNRFIEIHTNVKTQKSSLLHIPDTVEVYVSDIEPKHCESVMKQLSIVLPLPTWDDFYSLMEKMNRNMVRTQSQSNPIGNSLDLDTMGSIQPIPLNHLRRVCRRNNYITGNQNQISSEDLTFDPHSTDEQKPKGQKRKMITNSSAIGTTANDLKLEILIGSVRHIDSILKNLSMSSSKPLDQTNHEEPFDGAYYLKDPETGCSFSSTFPSPTCNHNSHNNRHDTIETTAGLQLQKILDTYNLHLTKRTVPGRPAQSQNELKEWNQQRNDTIKIQSKNDSLTTSWWPTLFFSERTEEYFETKFQLTPQELEDMERGMKEAIFDAQQNQDLSMSHITRDQEISFEASTGTVIVCPTTKKVVASSYNERRLQTDLWNSNMDLCNTLRYERDIDVTDIMNVNPLCTSILFAIQGVSRKERAMVSGFVEMDATECTSGQYLCTGYDVFTTREPSIYEAMALVHARIRRLVYGVSNSVDGGLGGAGMRYVVHNLPGTNHHYRVFQCNPNPSNDLFTCCEQLYSLRI